MSRPLVVLACGVLEDLLGKRLPRVRLGIKSDPRLIHDTCSEIKGEKVFLIKADGQIHQRKVKAEYKMPE